MALEQAGPPEPCHVPREITHATVSGGGARPVCRSELCGATHRWPTPAEIGLFKISAKAAWPQGIRRIEAVAGRRCLPYPKGREQGVRDLASVSSPAGGIVRRVERPAGNSRRANKALGRGAQRNWPWPGGSAGCLRPENRWRLPAAGGPPRRGEGAVSGRRQQLQQQLG